MRYKLEISQQQSPVLNVLPEDHSSADGPRYAISPSSPWIPRPLYYDRNQSICHASGNETSISVTPCAPSGLPRSNVDRKSKSPKISPCCGDVLPNVPNPLSSPKPIPMALAASPSVCAFSSSATAPFPSASLRRPSIPASGRVIRLFSFSVTAAKSTSCVWNPSIRFSSAPKIHLTPDQYVACLERPFWRVVILVVATDVSRALDSSSCLLEESFPVLLVFGRLAGLRRGETDGEGIWLFVCSISAGQPYQIVSPTFDITAAGDVERLHGEW